MNIGDVRALRHFSDKNSWSFDDKFKKTGTLSVVNNDVTFSINTTESGKQKYINEFDRIISSSGSAKIAIYDSRGFPGFTGLDGLLGYHKKNDQVRIYYKPMRVVVQEMSKNKSIPKKISNIKLIIPGINIWMNENLLRFSYVKNGFERNDTIDLNFDYSNFAKIHLKVDVILTESIHDEFVGKHECYVEIEFNRPTSYGLAVWYAKSVEEFFNFIFTELTNQFHFTSKNGTDSRGLPITTEIIDVWRYEKLEPRTHGYNMFFKMNDIQAPTSLISNWITAYTTKNLPRVLDSLKILENDKNSDAKSKFLSLVGAIENIHRDFIQKSLTKQDREDQVQWLKKVTAELDVEDKIIVLEKLKYSYEPSLKERLLDVYAIVVKLGVPQMASDMLNKIAPTRNKEMHSLNTTSNILTFSEISTVNHLLHIYLKVVILKILGLSNLEISSIVGSTYQFRSNY